MRRIVIVGMSVLLLASACASAGELADAVSDDAPASVDASGAGSEEVPEDTPPALDDGSFEAMPPDPLPETSSLSDDEVVNESGDAPPTADDGDSMNEDGGNLPPVRTAMKLLASQLGISTDTIHWVSYEDVTWPDGSLGCPREGMSYTQALVSGFLIVLEVDGRAYEYHGEAGSDPFFCAAPSPPYSVDAVDR